MQNIRIHLLSILILSQIYVNFTLLRIHYFIALIAFSLLGLLTGLYLSFKTDKHIKFDLKSDDTAIQSNYLLNYKFYSDLVAYLSSLQTVSNRNSDHSSAHDDKLNKSLNSDQFTDDEFESLNNEQETCLLDDYFQDYNETESNSKIDVYLDDVLGLVVKDFIMVFLNDLFWDKEKFFSLVKNELKQLVTCLRKQMRHLDPVKLISSDLIEQFTAHLIKIRKFSNKGKFILNYFEMDSNKECEHLRNLIEILILTTFANKTYFKNSALRTLVKEVLLNKVLQPTIELICDPDYLNQNLLNYLNKKEAANQALNSKVNQAATYEDFIKIIKSSNNIDEIKQYHLKIMNEIIQATFISDKMSENNLNPISPTPNSSAIINSGLSSFYASFSNIKEQNEFDTIQSKQNSSNSDKNTKAEMLRSRNLKAYLKQLTYAKSLCERRLRSLSDSINDENYEANIENRIKSLKNPQPFESIIKSIKGQKLFLKFLEPDGSDALLRFSIDVEKMKHKSLNIRKKYELANKIFENYLKSYDSPVRDEIGKDLFKTMKLFLIGNSSENAFFSAQARIKKVLESDHYPSFLVTDAYEKLSKELDLERQKEIMDASLNTEQNIEETLMLRKRTDTSSSNDQQGSSYKVDRNKKKIEDLKRMVQIKMSALNAIKSNVYRQESDTKIIDKMETDIKTLKQDLSMFQTHVRKTQEYISNMGNWRTTILKAIPNNTKNNATNEANNDQTILFEIQVQLYEDNLDPEKSNDNNIKEGWFIHRSLKQFETLYESLYDISGLEINNQLKKFPKLKRQLSSKNIPEDKLKNATTIFDSYLKAVSKDDKLANSEALYAFLCPSSDFYKKKLEKTSMVASDDKFSISSIFRSSKQNKETEEEDLIDQLFADNDLKTLDSKDSTAEPFYQLLEELFELKGMKKWFRKSLILFVQLTYGATINKKIRESIYWLLSEDSISFYIKQLKDSFWYFNKEKNQSELIVQQKFERTIEEKNLTKTNAKKKLLNNVPDALQKLIGEKNAQIGLVKLFESFQDKKLNKHLIYTLIELFTNELCTDQQDKTKTN